MAEVPLFSERGITITTSRLVVGNQTYAVRAITSTKLVEVKEPERQNFSGCGIAAIGVAALVISPAIFSGEGGIGAGIAFLTVLVLLFLWVRRDGIQPPAHQPKSTYSVVITTAAGEVQVLADHEESFVRRVNAALTEAMANHA